MSTSSHLVVLLAGSILGFWLLPACGGQFQGPDEGQGGSAGSVGGASRGGTTAGKGGSTGKGGTGVGGSQGGSTGKSCDYLGQTYADGESFPAGDGCNTCGCDN